MAHLNRSRLRLLPTAAKSRVTGKMFPTRRWKGKGEKAGQVEKAPTHIEDVQHALEEMVDHDPSILENEKPDLISDVSNKSFEQVKEYQEKNTKDKKLYRGYYKFTPNEEKKNEEKKKPEPSPPPQKEQKPQFDYMYQAIGKVKSKSGNSLTVQLPDGRKMKVINKNGLPVSTGDTVEFTFSRSNPVGELKSVVSRGYPNNDKPFPKSVSSVDYGNNKFKGNDINRRINPEK